MLDGLGGFLANSWVNAAETLGKNACLTVMPRRRKKAWKKTGRWVPPPKLQDRPAAWKSPLWDHLESLKAWAGQRPKLSWKEIAERLEQEKGLKVPWRTVYKFFARTDRRAREGKLPLGMKPADRSEAAPAAKSRRPGASKPEAEPGAPKSPVDVEGYWQNVSHPKPQPRSSLFTPDKLQ